MNDSQPIQSEFCDTLPKVFLERYLSELGAHTFCLLARLYRFYLKHADSKDGITVPYYVFKQTVLFNNLDDLNERIFGDLDYYNLVKRRYKENLYILNLTQINRDNAELLKINGKVKTGNFKIYLKSGKILRKKGAKVKPDIHEYVDRIIYKYTQALQNKIKKLVEGVMKFFEEEKGSVEVNDISTALMPLIHSEASDKGIERVCDVYNENHWGTKHPRYIHGILKNVEKEEASKTSVTQTPKQQETTQSFKSKNLERFKKDKEESDRKMALKIATGKAFDSKAYKAYVELEDFKGLKKLYKLGCELLEKEDKEDEIYKGYDWL